MISVKVLFHFKKDDKKTKENRNLSICLVLSLKRVFILCFYSHLYFILVFIIFEIQLKLRISFGRIGKQNVMGILHRNYFWTGYQISFCISFYILRFENCNQFIKMIPKEKPKSITIKLEKGIKG